jgi:LacI family transcriptional regulator
MTDIPRVALLLQPFAGFDRGLLEGIARYVRLHGPWLFCLSAYNPGVPMPDSDSIGGELLQSIPVGKVRRSPSLPLQRLGTTGVIGRIQSPGAARTLLASGLPTIAVELTSSQLDNRVLTRSFSEIRSDSHRAGQIAAEHLLDCGLTNLAFCGFQGRIWSGRRQEGFCQRVRAAGLACEVYQSPCRRAMPWHREHSRVIAWVRSLAKPVGIMACNDNRGRQVIEACLQAGLRVPDDVAVVGVDEDRLLCEMANPPLSSVALNLERAGYQAAELLDGLMSGRVKQPRRITVDAMSVTPRRSTDILAVEDRHVAAAARFVRDHFREPITVDDVVTEAGCSRRSLEIRFQRCLGRSIRQEIQRTRLAWSKRLAAETNLSVEKIAAASGFSGLSYLSQVFRRELGMTLSEYRRQLQPP